MLSKRNQTILIVDDDEGLRTAIAVRLASSGFRCITAGTGAQGLAEFSNGGIDLIVSDLNMPSGDGVSFAEAVRQTSEVPIVFVTGFKDDFKRRVRSVQNIVTLRKPFDGRELAALIGAILGEHAATHAAELATKEAA